MSAALPGLRACGGVLLAALVVACTPRVIVAYTGGAAPRDDAGPGEDATMEAGALDAPTPDAGALDVTANDELPADGDTPSGCPTVAPDTDAACGLEAGTHCEYPATNPCHEGLTCACSLAHAWTCGPAPSAMRCDGGARD